MCAHTQMYVRKLHAGGLWERVEQARGEGWGGMEVGSLPHRVLMRTKVPVGHLGNSINVS